jgi:DNA-binding NtrC family response regulator
LKKVLVVDDRIQSLKGLVGILEDEGYQVLQAAGGAEALTLFESEKELDVILADLKMPGMNGLELFRNMSAIRPVPPFIIMTAFGTVRSAVEALREGVTDYLIKPLDYEELTLVLDKAVQIRAMSCELLRLRQTMSEGTAFHQIIGADPRMKDIYDLIRTVGPTDASVLIYGETGTGKELLARAIHQESHRRERSLICLNCAALTENLLEAELFGHAKGAFTGAYIDKKGRLEAADGGTLLLDEIGHMSLGLQAKLLRFLQDMSFEPVGSSMTRVVDVRIIAATNLDLKELIRQGRFLADLLYRIEVITIRVPPIRERKDDIPLLVDHFIRRYAQQYGKEVEGVAPEVMKSLLGHDWPGNVREIKNCLARAVIMSKGRTLGPHDFPIGIMGQTSSDLSNRTAGAIVEIPADGFRLQDMEMELIGKTLEKCGGNKSLTAKLLGISRKALYQKIERLQIRLPNESVDD